MTPEHQRSRGEPNLLELFRRADAAETSDSSKMQQFRAASRKGFREVLSWIIQPTMDASVAARNAAEEPIKRRIAEFFHKLGIAISAESLFKVKLKDKQITIVIAPTYGEISSKHRSGDTSGTKPAFTAEQIVTLSSNGFTVTGGSSVIGPVANLMAILGERA